MNEYILGINLPVLPDGTITYDGNVTLATREKIVTALAEERISKVKYDGHVACAVKEILTRNKLTLDDIQAVSVVSFGQSATEQHVSDNPLKNEIKVLFPNFSPVHYVTSHHEAHALSAVSQVGVARALVVVADHTGNFLGEITDTQCFENNEAEQTSYYLFENNNLTLLARDHALAGDAGYGRFYGDVTCYLGFNSYRESGKTMGLASFGSPDELSACSPFYETAEGGRSALKNENYCSDSTKNLQRWFQHQGVHIPDRRNKDQVIRPFDMNLAAWAQDQLQRSLVQRLKGFLQRYPVDMLCVAGGVAMNSVLNRKLEEALGINVYVPPSPGDAGLAIGAAAHYFWKENGQIPTYKSSPWLGPVYAQEEIAQSVYDSQDEFIIQKLDDPEKVAARYIAEGKIVGWYQGRSEFGPRALGNRSILASPSNSWTKEILNHQVKRREWFRPYAPVVLEEYADIYFHMLTPVPFMMKVAPARQQAKLDIPACIHVDNTARLQTLNAESNPIFYRLIQELGRLTGVPVVLNTSFNLAGMPIVETPQDAIQCFRQADGMNALFIESYLLEKHGMNDYKS